ncbi:MAG TPA: VWA domain-containing protein [Flavobacteriaceae bacterium]|nr:VWA domain-containing protein [Flavobacteriaceae bacterium]
MVEYFNNIIFENPSWFWLLLVIPLLVLWYVLNYNKQKPAVKISSLKGFKVQQGILPKLRPVLFGLQMLGLALLITAMARPTTLDITKQAQTSEAIDIMMTIDVSGSMLAKDLKPDRLQALKEVAVEFVEKRPSDRIGLVIYAGESYTRLPVTSDKNMVINSLKDIEYDTRIKDGTAIGMGLATAVSRLKDSPAESRVIILLTDGVNNTGQIDPQTATELAKKYNMKVYTIGLGTNGMAMSPVARMPNGELRFEMIQVEIDEELMKVIAKETGGRYFRATDKHKLEEIYDEISELETTEIEEFTYESYTEKFRPLVILAGVLFLFEFSLRYTLFRSFV